MGAFLFDSTNVEKTFTTKEVVVIKSGEYGKEKLPKEIINDSDALLSK